MAGKRSNGEGQLRQRKNGLWELSVMVGYHDDGRRKLKSFYGKTQKEAKDKFAQYRHDQDLGLDTESKLTFQQLAETWYEGMQGSVEASTYESYRYTLAILLRAFGDRQLRSIKPIDVENFLKNMREEGRSDSYLTKCRGMLYQIMQKAEANDYVQKNPVRLAEKMRRNNNPVKAKDSFTKEEVDLLLEQLPRDRIGHSIRLMIGSGLRLQELGALQPEHIEPDGSQLYIRQAVKSVKGKMYIGATKNDGSTRDVPIAVKFHESAIYLRENAEEFIWPGKNLGRPRDLKNIRKKYMEALEQIDGVRLLTPHCCRYTFISHMQAAGVDIETIKKLVGHASIEMTEHYLKVQKEPLQDATERYNKLFDPDDN